MNSGKNSCNTCHSNLILHCINVTILKMYLVHGSCQFSLHTVYTWDTYFMQCALSHSSDVGRTCGDHVMFAKSVHM